MKNLQSKIFTKLYNSAIFTSWISQGSRLLFSLIVIPVIVIKLSTEEINVWFLLTSIVILGQSIQFGFNPTFVRFISYAISGIRIRDFKHLKSKFNPEYNKNINNDELADLIITLKRIYLVLTIIFTILLITLGSLALKKPISFLDNPTSGWLSWCAVVVTSAISLYQSVYQIILLGLNQVALVQRVTALINIIGVFVIILVAINLPSLFNIVLVYQLIQVSITSILIFYFFKANNSLLLKLNLNRKFKWNVFKIIWDSAWKSGISVFISNTINQVSGLIVAHKFSTEISASFLFTKRIFEVLSTLSMTVFQAKLPHLSSLRGKGDLIKLMPIVKLVLYNTYGIIFLGYITLIIGGESLLTLIKGNTEFGSIELVITFSFLLLITRWGAICQGLSNQANNVIEHLGAMYGLLVYCIFILLFFNQLGIYSFPLAIIVSNIITMPIIIKHMYSTLNTTFLKFEKNYFIPALILLILINIFYYFF